MARIVVVARADGRGGFMPFVKHAGAHAGELVAVGGRMAKVSSDGRVNISKAIMNEIGIRGSDGRMRVSVEVGARTDDGIKSVGLYVSTPPSEVANVASGVIVPRKFYAEQVIMPSETEEYYPPD